MTVTYHHWPYAFRPCDTKGVTQEELQKKAEEVGRLQYEPNRVWLLIPGIGYGMEVWK